MSISELEARIEGFSTEIERHKEVLSELERSKSHAQRQLNALRDPLARIPVEISSEIFLHCVPTRSSLGRHHIPTLFLTICHGWSDIAVSIPALWAAIYIDLSEAAQGLETTVGNWLERARGHLLDVCLMGLMRETNQQVAELIWQYSGQLKSLDIDFANVDAHGHEDFEYRPLGDSGPQHPLPFLRTLTIGGHEELGCSWRPIHRLLSLAPHLVEFEASNMSFHDIPSPFVTELVLPNLRRLELSNAAALEWHTDILRWFSTPRLQNLSLPGASQDAVPFLQRLSPPLRRFRANIRTSPRGMNPRLQPILQLMPTLTHLELEFPSRDSETELFTILAEDPSMVPNLASLSLVNANIPSDSIWKMLVRAVSARHHKLRSIRINSLTNEASEETLAALRALLADGVDIQVLRWYDFGPNLLLSE